jgi:hypothetical protein
LRPDEREEEEEEEEEKEKGEGRDEMCETIVEI